MADYRCLLTNRPPYEATIGELTCIVLTKKPHKALTLSCHEVDPQVSQASIASADRVT